MIIPLIGFLFGYTLTHALGSWTEALVVITCLHILLLHHDSRTS